MRRWICGWWMLSLSLVCTSVAWGNMAKPWVDGDPISEPIGAFQQLHILSESLSFDFRSVEQKQSPQVVKVKATYHIEQRGPAATVPLYFVAPGLQKGTIHLDGAVLKGAVVKRKVPERWRVRMTRSESSGLLFQALLKPGKHTLTVSYDAAPIVHMQGAMVKRYELGYVLGPAKSWASFGGLKVSVHLPKGWQVTKNSLKLKRQGDVLLGAFQQVPADVMYLQATPPGGLLLLVVPAIIGFFAVLFVLFLWLLWRQGGAIFSGAYEARVIWLRSIAATIAFPGVYGVLSWGFLYVLFAWVVVQPHVALVGYGHLLWFALGIVIIPLVLLVSSVAILLIHRRRMLASGL